jgi:solute carrier family 20 (sodium-dependent phosphate transporter)
MGLDERAPANLDQRVVCVWESNKCTSNGFGVLKEQPNRRCFSLAPRTSPGKQGKMPHFHEYDYLFVIGLLFSSLDAYNIGANDVANSFATSVSSGSLSLRQACFIAAICEFLGAVLVGARVAGTIKNSIISLSAFQGNAGVQLLGFTCAITASASWLMLATHQSWPVSTTYSIVSAIIGVGIATAGSDAVRWGWNGGKGVSTIFAGFLIGEHQLVLPYRRTHLLSTSAPGLAGAFAAVVYLITKYGILARNNSIKWALIASPLYFFTVAAILTMSIRE